MPRPAAGPTAVGGFTATPAPRASAAAPRPEARPYSRPAPPPLAAGQGGKLPPLISKSAVIAVLAAAAALLILFLLHG
jgi:hypothetical protein